MSSSTLNFLACNIAQFGFFAIVQQQLVAESTVDYESCILEEVKRTR
jgi:hypothetical protein